MFISCLSWDPIRSSRRVQQVATNRTCVNTYIHSSGYSCEHTVCTIGRNEKYHFSSDTFCDSNKTSQIIYISNHSSLLELDNNRIIPNVPQNWIKLYQKVINVNSKMWLTNLINWKNSVLLQF